MSINTIGSRIDICLEAKGWSQTELARRAHLNKVHLWKIRQGLRPNLTAVTVVRLAMALGVTTDYLLGLCEERYNPFMGL